MTILFVMNPLLAFLLEVFEKSHHLTFGMINASERTKLKFEVNVCI